MEGDSVLIGPVCRNGKPCVVVGLGHLAPAPLQRNLLGNVIVVSDLGFILLGIFSCTAIVGTGRYRYC